MSRWLIASWLVLFAAGPIVAGEERKEIFKQKDELTTDDAKDKVFDKSFRKQHKVKLEAGKYYRIDLTSKDFDTFLRLEDFSGNKLAEDDDGGGSLNSRILFKPEKSGTFRLTVTSYDPNKTGSFTLVVTEASRTDSLALKASQVGSMGDDERTEYLADLKKFLQEKGDTLGGEEAKLAFSVGMAMERALSPKAGHVFTELGDILAKSSKDDVAKSGAAMQGAGRRLKLPGHEMLVKGTTLEGKEFDWKSYRGKVVLIDFWATWCGPCRAELPRLRKMHEMYKDKGFEVVGISLDRDRDALEKFQDKEKLPWVCLHEKGEGRNFLADYYGVFFIPQCILVDRDGKVISLRARGQELEKLLEQQFSN